MSAGGTPWPQARALAYDDALPLPPDQAPLDAALGCTLAEPLLARTPLPAFDTSAMDGYAVAGPPPWRVVGYACTGQPVDVTLVAGTAVEIATGALLPPGTESVVPYELASAHAGSVTSNSSGGAPAPGRHIRRAGEEARRGAVLAPAGCTVGPALLGLAAAASYDVLVVIRRPTVALLVTGNEIMMAGVSGGGLVRDAVGPMLPGLIDRWGGVSLATACVRDDLDTFVAAVTGAAADVIVTTGASSVGRADHLHRVLTRLGATILIDGVAVRPGHPQLLARLPDGRRVVGLPGNPLAALAGAVTLLQPLLAGLAGRPSPCCQVSRLAAAVTPSRDAYRLLPATRTTSGLIEATGPCGSAMLTGAAVAEGFAVIPPGSAALDIGADAGWLPLPTWS